MAPMETVDQTEIADTVEIVEMLCTTEPLG